MKVYTKAIILAAGLWSLNTSAQKDKCEKAYTALTEKVASQAYDEASPLLAGLRKDCPKYNSELYELGDKILLYKLTTAATDGEKNKAVETLLELYKQQQANFPGSGADIKQALLLSEHKKADDAEIYKLLDQAFTANSKLFTDYKVIELYFNLYFDQYNKGPKNTEAFIKKYGDLSGQAAVALKETETKRDSLQARLDDGKEITIEEKAYIPYAKININALEAVSDNMAKQGAMIFSCDGLERYYTTNLEQNEENTAWLQGMVSALKAAKCDRSPLLLKGITTLYEKKPDYTNTYDLAYYSQKKGDIKAAAAYYEEAANKQPAAIKKAEIYMAAATLYRNSDKAKAKDFALKSAALNTTSGRGYLFVAEMYYTAGNECGLSDFEKKALAWPAIAMAKKAVEAEPRLETTVDKLEERYAKTLPTKKEAKAAGKRKGDTIAFGCWINETLTLPKLK